MIGVVKVFEFFLEFDSPQVHNMLALLLDPRFKSLRLVESFVGCGNAICLAIEFDVKEVCNQKEKVRKHTTH